MIRACEIFLLSVDELIAPARKSRSHIESFSASALTHVAKAWPLRPWMAITLTRVNYTPLRETGCFEKLEYSTYSNKGSCDDARTVSPKKSRSSSILELPMTFPFNDNAFFASRSDWNDTVAICLPSAAGQNEPCMSGLWPELMKRVINSSQLACGSRFPTRTVFTGFENIGIVKSCRDSVQTLNRILK
jgi:hypothetical protein